MQIENWYKIRIETAKFIFAEAEKNLSQLIDANEYLTSKAEIIIKFTLPVCLALIGYITLKVDSKAFDFSVWAAIYWTVASILILTRTIDIFWLYKIRPLGNEPINMITNEKIESKNQELAFILTRKKSIQGMIVENKSTFNERLVKLKHIRQIIFWSIMVAIMVLATYIIALLYHQY